MEDAKNKKINKENTPRTREHELGDPPLEGGTSYSRSNSSNNGDPTTRNSFELG